jgi:phage terminase large subunit-like protein
MSVLSVPDLEEQAWPSLGRQVCDFIEAYLVFGPGDLRGQPAKLDQEKQGLIYRMYEVYPIGAKDANGKSIAGRRRFRRCALSLQKGSAKTELAAWIAAVELHPDGPVRCDGFDANGEPVGRPVVDPYIPMVAYTEEQSEDLAYAALKTILELSSIANDFDIGLERVMRITGDGKAAALAGAPDARDGARTTFAHKDETHRWTLERLRRAHRTMLANLPKRLLADPWELETTTAYSPGENSVAEQTASYARDVAEGKIRDSHLFFFHRQASDGYDIKDEKQLRAAVVEAAGPTAPWRDIEGIIEQWQDPEADQTYLERVYLNRPVATAAQAFNASKWAEMADRAKNVDNGQLITLGFDGSLQEDATALVATHVATGFQWPLGIWERPQTRGDAWEVPKQEVDAVVEEAFKTYDVWRMYADPWKWESWLASWAGKFGEKKVVAWSTTFYRKMATALKAYANAINAGEVSNNGDGAFVRHIGNAQKSIQNYLDDDGSPLWLIKKDRPGSPNKIDAAMAGCLSWQARLDAIESGVLNQPPKWSGILLPGDGEDEDEDEGE